MANEKFKKLLPDTASKILLALVILLAAPYVLRLVPLQLALPDLDFASQQTAAPTDLGVKTLIRAVKQELYDADLEARSLGEAALFRVNHFELEVNFIVRTRSSAGAQLSPQFIVIDKEMEVSNERVQKIKLYMSIIPEREISGQTKILSDSNDGEVQDLSAPPEGT